ncbi:tape measure protein [Macrococcoides canis]|uniref:tape measure protein n=1 Tax=Macrococcoides canis TaxID=1855823 RepID=UPI001F27C27A|nr:tape measure protein [Macrococcus canis]UJS28490.1 tape measure protein [Macrococcus canis]
MANGKVTIDVLLEDGQVAKGVADIEGQLDGIGRAGEKASGGIGSMVKGVAGVAAAVGVFKLFEGAIGGAVRRVDTLNNSDKVFKNMGFSAGETKTMMDNLGKSIDGLPTPLNEAVQGVQMIASATGDLSGSQKVYSALNNAILGFGGTSQDVSNTVLQLSQALANGKIDAETWNSMLDSQMGPTLKALAKDMGLTMGELKTGLSEGTISVEDFQNGLIKLNEKGGGGLASLQTIAKDATGGISTSLQNAKTSVVRGVANIITAINDGLMNAGLPSIGEMISGIGKAIETAFNTAAGAIGPIIGAFGALLNFLSPIKPLILGVVAGITALNVGIGIFNTLKNSITAVKGAMSLLNLTMLANPFVLIAVVIVGLVAALVYLYNTNETVRNSLNNLWNTISAFLMPIIQALITFIMTGWGMLVAWWQANNQTILTAVQTAWNFVSGIVNGVITAVSTFVMTVFGMLVAWWQQNNQLILQTIMTVWNAIAPFVSASIQGLMAVIQIGWNYIKMITTVAWNLIKTAVIIVWNVIKTQVQVAITLIGGIIRTVMQIINGDWRGAWNTIKSTAMTIWNLLRSSSQAIFNALKSGIMAIMNALKTGLSGIMNGIKALFSAAWNFMKALVMAVVNAIKAVVMAGFNLIRSIITSSLNASKAVVNAVFSFIRSFITSSVNAVKSIVTNVFNSLANVVRSAFENVKSAVKGGMEGAKSIVTGFLGQFKEAGANIVNSIADGIRGAAGKVKDAIGNVTSMIRDHLPFSPAKEGALRDIMYPGITNSIAKTIRKNAGTPVGEMANLTKSLANEMDITNRLNGAQLSFGGLDSNISANQMIEGTMTQSNSGIEAKLAEHAALLRQLLAKDNNTYLDGQMITQNTNKHNAIDDSLRRGFSV